MTIVANDHSVCLSHMLSTDFCPCLRFSLQKGFWLFQSNLKCGGWTGLSIPLIFCCLEVSWGLQGASVARCDLECYQEQEKSLCISYPIRLTNSLTREIIFKQPLIQSQPDQKGKCSFMENSIFMLQHTLGSHGADTGFSVKWNTKALSFPKTFVPFPKHPPSLYWTRHLHPWHGGGRETVSFVQCHRLVQTMQSPTRTTSTMQGRRHWLEKVPALLTAPTIPPLCSGHAAGSKEISTIAFTLWPWFFFYLGSSIACEEARCTSSFLPAHCTGQTFKQFYPKAFSSSNWWFIFVP